MRPLKLAPATLIGILFASTAVVRSSEPHAIYAIVTKVAMEPDERAPERIRIWGAFKVPLPTSRWAHKPAQRGFLYFTIQPDVQRTTWEEWFDLKRVAGTGQGVAFGAFGVPIPGGGPNAVRPLEISVHKDGDSAVPVSYPVNIGIIKVADGSEFHAKILTELTNALKRQ